MSRAVAAPHWARSLAWVLASVIVAALLAALTQAIGGMGRPAPGGPLTLSAAEVLLQDATAPALSPAQALAQGRWRPTGLPFSVGWARDTVWVRMQVHNTSAQPQSAWIEVSPSWLTEVRLHDLGPDGRWKTQISGNGLPVRDRPVQMAELAFPLELAPLEQRTVLVETTNQRFALTLGFAVQPAAAYPGHAERSNLLDLIFIGALVMLGLICLVLGLALKHLGLVLLAARAFLGVLLQLQQFGAGALFLTASASAALTAHAGWLHWAAQVLLVGFIWSFMSQAGLARWAHAVYASLLAISLLLGAAPSYQTHALLLIPLLGVTLVLTTHLIFKGYLPAVALLVGTLSAVMINAPGLAGQHLGWVPRYAVSPLPLLVTLPLLCLAAALALRRERVQAQALLREAQGSALRGLEEEVARRTAELQTARDEATRANKAKSIFLAKVSHELRTPMHALLGYLDLALREPLPTATARQLKAARGAGRELIGQVNDLLEHTRGERAMVKLEPAALALQGMAQRLQDRMALLERDCANRFELAYDSRLPPWVWADGSRIEQVLMVLLNNAMSYTRRGRVILRITALASPPSAVGDGAAAASAAAPLPVRFEVEDTGRGIAPQALQRLFQAFERGESSDADGLGLGLSISQQLLGLMDSRLEVTSQPGVGSRFAFTLHLRRANETEALVAPPDLSRYTSFTTYEGRTRQLLVLDDKPSRRLLEELLGDLGFDVRAFGDVAAALAFLNASIRCGEPGPDLCIVDQHLGPEAHPSTGGPQGRLPEHQQSGWDFIRALRGLMARPGVWAAGSQVLMLSATDARAPKSWPIDHGIDRHLLKPADPQLLLSTIGEMLGLEWIRLQSADAAGPALPAPPERNAATGVADESDAQIVTDAWQSLAALADCGSLSGLEDWLAAHPDLYAADARLQALVQALDFEGIARHALGAGLTAPRPLSPST